MKKRRKVLSVMLCAAMIASLAACGSKGDDKKSSDDGGKVKLTFSTSVYVEEPHQKAIDALLEAYSKKEPNVEIEILGAGYDGYWDNITTEILSNNESDMIQVYPENISTYNAIHLSFIAILLPYLLFRIMLFIGFPPGTIGSTISSVAIINSMTVGASVLFFAASSAGIMSSSFVTRMPCAP